MRRFIAGAVCPQCRAVDRTVLEGPPDAQRRVCVVCGFSEARPQASSGREPATRFSQRGEKDPAPTAVRIVGSGDD